MGGRDEQNGVALAHAVSECRRHAVDLLDAGECLQGAAPSGLDGPFDLECLCIDQRCVCLGICGEFVAHLLEVDRFADQVARQVRRSRGPRPASR